MTISGSIPDEEFPDAGVGKVMLEYLAVSVGSGNVEVSRSPPVQTSDSDGPRNLDLTSNNLVSRASDEFLQQLPSSHVGRMVSHAAIGQAALRGPLQPLHESTGCIGGVTFQVLAQPAMGNSVDLAFRLVGRFEVSQYIGRKDAIHR